MNQNLLRISKHNISIKEFKPLDFNLKDSLLYQFSDALSNSYSPLNGHYAFKNNIANDPQPPTKEFLTAGNLEEYPPYLRDLFSKYNEKVIYYPLGSNLYGYRELPNDDILKLQSSRLSYESEEYYNNISFKHFPNFYDGMSSYYNNNYFKINRNLDTERDVNFFVDSALKNKISTTGTYPFLKNTPHLMCEQVISSGISALTIYSEGISLDKATKYCFSFYIRKAESSKSEGELTLQCSINGSTVKGYYYSDSHGYNTSNLEFTDIWQRGSYVFDGASGTVKFTILLPSKTEIGGFLLEPSAQSSLYEKVLVNESPYRYHPIAIKLKKKGTYGIESLSEDWTISFTKVGGQVESKERIGNLLITENLGDSSKLSEDNLKGSLSVTYTNGEVHTISFPRPKKVNSNFSTRRYTFVYTKSKNQLDIYISYNFEFYTVHCLVSTYLTNSLPTVVNVPYTKEDNSSSIWQYHIILGGSSPTELCNSTRYRDLVFIQKALTLEEIKVLENKAFTLELGSSKYESTLSTRDSNGKITSSTQKVEYSTTQTKLISSIIIGKET